MEPISNETYTLQELIGINEELISQACIQKRGTGESVYKSDKLLLCIEKIEAIILAMISDLTYE